MYVPLVGFILLLGAVATCHSWDFRDEVYTCTTSGMSLAELQSAGVTLVSHVTHTREWMDEARTYGIRGMPYISLYKVYDLSVPGASPDHPFWSAVAMNDHPEWVYIGPDGERKRPFNNPYYPKVNWQSCTNNPGIADAYCRGAAGVMDQGAGGVFIDNVLPAQTCHGPEFGIHQHLYAAQDNIYSFKIALRRVRETVKSYGPDSVMMLNVGSPWDRWQGFGDCIMLESFIFNIRVRPGPGGWVGKEHYQAKQWPQILEWIEQTAPFVDGGGNIVALEYLPDDPRHAYFSYACDKLANFLWTASCNVRRDVLRTLYRCGLQRASGPLQEAEGLYYRHYPNGMVAVNPTEERISLRLPAPPGCESLADVATDEILTLRRGKVRVGLDPGAVLVSISPQRLAEGHLREVLVGIHTALEQAAPDEGAEPPPALSAAAEAVRSAHAVIQDAPELTDAAEPLATALRKLSECAATPSEPDLSQRLVSGEKLSRDEVRQALAPDRDDGPRCEIGEDGVFVTAGGIRWEVGGTSALLRARGMGANLGLTMGPLHELHGWLHPTNVLEAKLTTDEPDRKVAQVTLDFVGQKSKEVISGAQFSLELEARRGDPMLSVSSTVKNVGEEPFPAYFTWSTSGAGTWCSRPGEPAASADDYVQIPSSDWTYVHRSEQGGPGLMIFTDLPQSYSPYAINLYSEPRSGELAPGASRSLDFAIGLIRGAWQHDPRAMGAVRRAQLYASRAYTLATEGEGLPEPSVTGEDIAGMPIGVRMCSACAAVHGLDLKLTGACLLDANGAETVPAELELAENVAILHTRPSLRDDLYFQVVAHYETEEGGVPLALSRDLRLGPSLSMDVGDAPATWQGSRGEATCRVTNHLAEEVVCRLLLEVPDGYTTPELAPLKLGPGESTQVPLVVTSPEPSAPPAAVRALLRLEQPRSAGELATEVHFRPAAVCPRIEAPALDGKLDDAAWQQAVKLGPFALVADGAPPQETTQALVGRDEEYLYVAFECMESRILEIHAEAEPAPGVSNPAVHQDDSVEVFLAPPGDAPYVQLAASCTGAQKTRGEVRWEVATSRGKDRWTVEMRIALDSLGAPIEKGARWGGNFCRTQIRLKEHSAWSPTGRSFHTPERFGVLIFE